MMIIRVSVSSRNMSSLIDVIIKCFLAGFKNPPVNFECRVKFSNVNYPWPRLEMQWQNPDFIAFGEIPGFQVYSTFPGIDINESIRGFHYEIELDGIDDIETAEGVYHLLVRGDARSNANEDYLSAPARCDINTLKRGIQHYHNIIILHCKTYYDHTILLRITALNPPLPLKITCSNSPNHSVTIRWTNPLATDSLNVNIKLIELKATCLYGNHPLYNVGFHIQYSDVCNELWISLTTSVNVTVYIEVMIRV